MQATAHEVAKSRTGLSDFTFTFTGSGRGFISCPRAPWKWISPPVRQDCKCPEDFGPFIILKTSTWCGQKGKKAKSDTSQDSLLV